MKQEQNKLSKYLIEQIFEVKKKAVDYEIDKDNFEEIQIDPYGDCFYCCLSEFFESNQDNHLFYRNQIFDYITNNEEKFETFFEGTENENGEVEDKKNLLKEYIETNNKPGKYAGDMELSAFVLIYPYKLYIFERGFKNLNILNIYENKEIEINNIENFIYLIYNKTIKNYTLLTQNKKK